MEFFSESGVHYLYDETIGISYPINEEKGYNCNSEDDDFHYLIRYKEKIKKINPLSRQPNNNIINPDNIKKTIFREGLHQITLNVTEECNLACKYCIYSDVYQAYRKSNNRHMDYYVAKRAIDDYFHLLDEGKKYNPNRRATIGFYGGEPLLNYPLIKDCVSYINQTYLDYNPNFLITTNGTLLDEKRINFLIDNNFSIAISLDGPKEEHDRNRVYKNGKGTYSDVLKNINKIVKKNYKKIHILTVFDYKSDLFALHRFFNQRNLPKLSNITMPSIYDECLYYSKFSKEEKKNYFKKESIALKWYLENFSLNNEHRSFFDFLFGIPAQMSIFSTMSLINDHNGSLIPYTGTCIPGNKIFVDVDGQYHICERINHNFPIGDIRNGLNYDQIEIIIRKFNEKLDICPSCSFQKSCNKCYCAFTLNGDFKLGSSICENIKKEEQQKRSLAFSFGEKNPELLNCLFDYYYSWISSLMPTIGD